MTEVETTLRYLHILSGIVWIGLLYFFNLVNLPLIKFQIEKPFNVDMAEKATPNITLKSLWWFRYGALFTLLTGLALLDMRVRSFPGGWGEGGLQGYFSGPSGAAILIGIILAIVMFINVWFVIWPNQKAILGGNKRIAEGAVDDEEKARIQDENKGRLKNAVMASRFNTWASVPMLFGMVFGAHPAETWTIPVLVLGAILFLMVIFSNIKKK